MDFIKEETLNMVSKWNGVTSKIAEMAKSKIRKAHYEKIFKDFEHSKDASMLRYSYNFYS